MKNQNLTSVGRRRGPPARGEPSARDRILSTAERLFYEEGIQVTGVDTLVELSGISKTSLYRTFDSKDAVVAAVLKKKDAAYWDWWDGLIAEAGENPKARLKAIMSGISRHIAESAHRGCPFIKAAAELAEPDHPARQAVSHHMQELRRRCTVLATDLGARKPSHLGNNFVMLINGAYACAGVNADIYHEGTLLAAALALAKDC